MVINTATVAHDAYTAETAQMVHATAPFLDSSRKTYFKFGLIRF